MKTKYIQFILVFFLAISFLFPFVVPKAEAYFNAYAYGPYYGTVDPLYAYSALGYAPYGFYPSPIVPYRSADALLTTLALLGALPTTTSTLSTSSTIGTTTALLLGGSSTTSLLLASTLSSTTPTYSYPSYPSYPSTSLSSTSTGIGLTTAILLGGSTSSTTLLALGI